MVKQSTREDQSIIQLLADSPEFGDSCGKPLRMTITGLVRRRPSEAIAVLPTSADPAYWVEIAMSDVADLTIVRDAPEPGERLMSIAVDADASVVMCYRSSAARLAINSAWNESRLGQVPLVLADTSGLDDEPRQYFGRGHIHLGPWGPEVDPPPTPPASQPTAAPEPKRPIRLTFPPTDWTPPAAMPMLPWWHPWSWAPPDGATPRPWAFPTFPRWIDQVLPPGSDRAPWVPPPSREEEFYRSLSPEAREWFDWISRLHLRWIGLDYSWRW